MISNPDRGEITCIINRPLGMGRLTSPHRSFPAVRLSSRPPPKCLVMIPLYPTPLPVELICPTDERMTKTYWISHSCIKETLPTSRVSTATNPRSWIISPPPDSNTNDRQNSILISWNTHVTSWPENCWFQYQSRGTIIPSTCHENKGENRLHETVDSFRAGQEKGSRRSASTSWLSIFPPPKWTNFMGLREYCTPKDPHRL